MFFYDFADFLTHVDLMVKDVPAVKLVDLQLHVSAEKTEAITQVNTNPQFSSHTHTIILLVMLQLVYVSD